MGLFSHALAVGAGYALARPEARRKLVELAQHPKVTQLRDQSQDMAASGLQTVKHRLSRVGATDANTSASSTHQPLPSDPAALGEGVLPPAESAGGATAGEDPQTTAAAPLPPGPVAPTSRTDTP
jgi:hypothetical protein